MKPICFFLLTGLLRRYLSFKKGEKFITAFRASLKPKSFAALPGDGNVTKVTFGGVLCEIIEPSIPQLNNDRILVYFHGGGFVGGDLDSHRDPVYRIAKSLNVNAIHVKYSLAPETVYPTPMQEAKRCLNEISSCAEYKEIILAGDSAGGLLALHTAVNADTPLSRKLIGLYLISPWLDTTNQLADQSGNNNRDRILSLHFLNEAARAFFAESAPINFVDRLDYDNLKQLKIVYVSVGGDDLLIKDAQALIKKLAYNRIPYYLSCAPKMSHAFTVCAKFIKEADDDINDAAEIINDFI